MFVADAVAEGRNAERRHAVEIAGGEAAQSAAAETGIGFAQPQPVEVLAEAGDRLAHRLKQAEVAERVDQQFADQEFDREIIDALGLALRRAARALHPHVDGAVPRRQRDRRVPFAIGRRLRCRTERISELGHDRLAQRADGGIRPRLVTEGLARLHWPCPHR